MCVGPGRQVGLLQLKVVNSPFGARPRFESWLRGLFLMRPWASSFPL